MNPAYDSKISNRKTKIKRKFLEDIQNIINEDYGDDNFDMASMIYWLTRTVIKKFGEDNYIFTAEIDSPDGIQITVENINPKK